MINLVLPQKKLVLIQLSNCGLGIDIWALNPQIVCFSVNAGFSMKRYSGLIVCLTIKKPTYIETVKRISNVTTICICLEALWIFNVLNTQ